jgi:hypothetical protein
MKHRYQNGFENHAEVEVRWEEQESSTDASKCEKICINLLSRKNSENLNITITVMLNTGRIQIQGRYIKEWVSEFNTLLEFINSAGSEPPTSSFQTDLDIFVEKIFSKTHKDKTLSCQIPVSSSSSVESHTLNINNEQSPSREKSFSVIKNNLASLEADYVQFKQNSEKAVSNLSALMKNKDEEIEKKKILRKKEKEKRKPRSHFEYKQQ